MAAGARHAQIDGWIGTLILLPLSALPELGGSLIFFVAVSRHKAEP
jgi:hypothetical protein